MNEILQESITLYKSGLSLSKTCQSTGISISCLWRYLKNQDLMRSNKQNSRKYTLNHDFFQTIKSILVRIYLCRWLCVYTSKPKKIGISLSEADECHLKQFKTAINATYPIKHYVNKSCWGFEVSYVRLLMTSDQMFDDLFKKGVILHKSLVLTFPSQDIVPAHLTHHFIRGYFDGDGSFSKTNKPNSPYTIKICGTKEFLNGLSNHINYPNRLLNRRHKEKTNNNYSIEIGGRQQVMAIGKYMYENATVYMERKHERYIETTQYKRQPVRNQYSK